MLATYHTAQSKEAKMEEWKKLPLDFGEQRQSWQREKMRISRNFPNVDSGLVLPILEPLELSTVADNWMGALENNSERLDTHQSQHQTRRSSQTHTQNHPRIGMQDISSHKTERIDLNARQLLVDKESASRRLSQSQMVDVTRSQHPVNQDLILGNNINIDGQFTVGEMVNQHPLHIIPQPANPGTDVMMNDNTSTLQSTQDAGPSILTQTNRNTRSLSTKDWHKYF
jgi:hypothetical protein